MGEREWWQNVYPSECGYGMKHQTALDCAMYASRRTIGRVHVRLKPEGAPKRYADEWERHAWETEPKFMRSPYAPCRRYLETEGTLS